MSKLMIAPLVTAGPGLAGPGAAQTYTPKTNLTPIANDRCIIAANAKVDRVTTDTTPDAATGSVTER